MADVCQDYPTGTDVERCSFCDEILVHSVCKNCDIPEFCEGCGEELETNGMCLVCGGVAKD
jgi:hypothetical protein